MTCRPSARSARPSICAGVSAASLTWGSRARGQGLAPGSGQPLCRSDLSPLATQLEPFGRHMLPEAGAGFSISAGSATTGRLAALSFWLRTGWSLRGRPYSRQAPCLPTSGFSTATSAEVPGRATALALIRALRDVEHVENTITGFVERFQNGCLGEPLMRIEGTSCLVDRFAEEVDAP